MAQDLKEYLAGRKCKGFSPVPHYFKTGDFVSYFFKPDRCYAQRVDDLLTIYLSFQNHELVGCKIKGVKHILDEAGAFGVSVQDGSAKLGLFFFLGSVKTKDEAKKQRYKQLGQLAKDVQVELCGN